MNILKEPLKGHSCDYWSFEMKEREKERKKEEEKRIAELPVVRIELRTFRSSVLPLELPKVLLRQGTLVHTSEISFLKCCKLDISKNVPCKCLYGDNDVTPWRLLLQGLEYLCKASDIITKVRFSEVQPGPLCHSHSMSHQLEQEPDFSCS